MTTLTVRNVDPALKEELRVRAARRREGRPIEAFDAQIAATAMVAGAGLAARDTGGFTGCGLTVINPWEVP